jgi:predicted RNase H-like HicB family nuclease
LLETGQYIYGRDYGPACNSATVIHPGAEVMTMKEQLTAVFQQVSEGYIGFVEELPGANTQGAMLEEARSNLREAVQLVLEANRTLVEEDLRDKPVIREPFAQIS